MLHHLIPKLVLLLAVISLTVVSASSLTKITILFTTKNDGTLRDCGCGNDCQGGLAERMTLLKQFRDELGRIILVDGGDFFTTMGRQRKDEYVIQAYESLGYDAIECFKSDLV